MFKKIIQFTLYLLFIALISAPLLQLIHPTLKIKPLKGAVVNSKQPKLSKKTWLNGDYQENYEKYINDNIGFRPFFIRIYNQMQYSLFKKAIARKVIIGQDNYFFEEGYLKAFNGENYKGEEFSHKKAVRLKKLQDKLSEHDITLIVCTSPGKGTFYSEYFPKDRMVKETEKTNYKALSKYLKELDVNYIDFNQWFLDLKDTCDCMLYPKYGIHWSHYGMLLSADSLIKYVEKKRNINLSSFKFKKIERTNNLRGTDYDIAAGMNLLFNLKTDPMCYPKIEWIHDSTQVKPKLLVISDSFYWSMSGMGFGTKAFRDGNFWYYNNRVFPKTNGIAQKVKDQDIRARILENDVIILMATEANIGGFDWNFSINALKVLAD